jgi:hypothetical protein
VDGTSEVEIRGDRGTLRQIVGEPPHWERFECSGPLPYSSGDLHIRAIQGNGKMTLTHDSAGGGVAVVRLTNLDPGDQLYTFDVFWTPAPPPTYTSSSADRAMVEDDDAIQSCRTAVENRVRNDGYRYVRFGALTVDAQGPDDRVIGTATGDHRYGSDVFSFSCRVNSYGQVRRLDVTRR